LVLLEHKEVPELLAHRVQKVQRERKVTRDTKVLKVIKVHKAQWDRMVLSGVETGLLPHHTIRTMPYIMTEIRISAWPTIRQACHHLISTGRYSHKKVLQDLKAPRV